MKQLLATIVFAIAVFAGFTARAQAANDYKIYYSLRLDYVWCGFESVRDKDDVLLSTTEYHSHKLCNKSEKFTRFSEKYNNKGLKPKDIEDKEKANPLLKDLDERILSVEDKPMTDKRILAYTKYFEKMTGLKVDRSKIFFGKIKPDTVGMCMFGTDVVIMDKTWWNGDASEYSKEGLFYHELGHCYAERDHNDAISKKFKDEKELCPVTLMNPQAFDYKHAYRCFNKHRKYYMNEFKNPAFTKLEINLMKYTWDKKKGGWETLPSFLNVTSGYKFKVGMWKCTVYAGKNKKQGNYIERFGSISCTKDYVNYAILGHTCSANTKKSAYRQGWAKNSRRSSDLQLQDTLLDELHAVVLTCTPK